jgi:acetylornithine aminotransferase
VAADVADAAQQAGYLINPPQRDVIRLAPPLILDHDDAARFVADLPAALEKT